VVDAGKTFDRSWKGAVQCSDGVVPKAVMDLDAWSVAAHGSPFNVIKLSKMK